MTIDSKPPSPLLVLEGKPLTLNWTFSVGKLLRVELDGISSKLEVSLVESSPTSSSIRGTFRGRVTAISTEINATITFSSVNRTDTDNYRFKVFDDDGSFAVESLEIIVQCKYNL